MECGDIFLERLPKIDLHGYDRESARVAVDDFIREAILMGNLRVVVIHGIGSGIVKDSVQETLGKNRNVESYHIDSFNLGCTIVNLRNGD